MWRFELVIASVLLLSTAACEVSSTGVEPSNPAVAGSYERLIWPQPPAPSRIRYVRSIAEARDIGIEKSFLGKLVEAVTGNDQGRMVRPTGVTERDGVIYVADSGAGAVWIFDPENQRSTKVVEVGGAALMSPVAIADRPDGSVFVADSYLRKVFLLDREGKLLRTVAQGSLRRPAALAYDEISDRLYVADSVGQCIAVYASDGRHLLTWGKRGYHDGEFNYPSYLTLDRAGALLVTDALNYRVQAFDQNGRFLWKRGHHGDGSGDFAAPKGVAVDSEGHLYVVDALFDAVQIFDEDGGLLLSFGDRGTQPGEFWLPEGAFISKQDRIYVADSLNRRIQVFEFLGGTQAPKQPADLTRN